MQTMRTLKVLVKVIILLCCFVVISNFISSTFARKAFIWWSESVYPNIMFSNQRRHPLDKMTFPKGMSSTHRTGGVNVTGLQIRNLTQITGVLIGSTHIPKVIFMLWHAGWRNAPILNRICIDSFRSMNPDFVVLGLNLTEAEQLIDRRRFYSNSAWDSATIQAKSDIIRVELLAKFGGIWSDATVYCNAPLTKWLNESLLKAHFLAFTRNDTETHPGNSPWISSWFLVAESGSELLRILKEKIRNAWKAKTLPHISYGYYWFHRIFRNLTIWNAFFKKTFSDMPFLDAAGPHCFQNSSTVPYLYKMTTDSCKAVRRRIAQ